MEQGLQKVLQILKHLCTKTTLGDTIDIAIKAHQIHAGVALPILEYTDPIPWMTNHWLSNVWYFLHKIQGKIKLASLWVINILRQNNTHLMLNFQNTVYDTKEHKTLNHCRLALQVTMLVKIVNHIGQHLLTKALTDGKTLPMLTNISKSNYIWPNQPSHSKSAWKFWTKALWNIFTKLGLPNQLTQELGPWNPNAFLHCMWHATFNTRGQAVYLHVPSTLPQCFELARTTCSYSFYQQPQMTQQWPTKYPLTLDPQHSSFCIRLPISIIPSLATAPSPPTTNIPWNNSELSTI